MQAEYESPEKLSRETNLNDLGATSDVTGQVKVKMFDFGLGDIGEQNFDVELKQNFTCSKHDAFKCSASHLNQKLRCKPRNLVPICLPSPVLLILQVVTQERIENDQRDT